MDDKSKVYIHIDDKNRIIACDGGYSISNIKNFEDWVMIDEGYGDRYNLCQSNYFDTLLYEEHGIPIYKYENGCIVERTETEIETDIAAIPLPESQTALAELQQLYAESQAKQADMAAALEILNITTE